MKIESYNRGDFFFTPHQSERQKSDVLVLYVDWVLSGWKFKHQLITSIFNH